MRAKILNADSECSGEFMSKPLEPAKADRNRVNAYATKKATAAISRMLVLPLCETNSPTTKTPSMISIASEIEQIEHTSRTCLPERPCLSTNAFCAPMAKISERDSANPVIAWARSNSARPSFYSLLPQSGIPALPTHLDAVSLVCGRATHADQLP